MRARTLSTEAKTGTVAADYIESVKYRKRVVAYPEILKEHPAQQVLKVFEENNKPPPADPAPPVKGLIKILTQDIQGMPGLLVYGDGKEIGARLFTGCEVRLVGIPERRFVVDEIFWDFEEARLREIGTNIYYTVPWDCVEFLDE